MQIFILVLTIVKYILKTHNSKDEFGLVQYGKLDEDYLSEIGLADENIIHYVEKYGNIIPSSFPCKPTVKKHYVKNHNEQDFEKLETVIRELYPDQIEEFNKFTENEEIHFLNMFVMEKGVFFRYCDGLFLIIFQLLKTVDITGYPKSRERTVGFLAE